MERSENIENNKPKKKKRWILIILLLLLIAACVSITTWALFFREGSIPIAPDYPPQGVEDNQKPLENDDSEKMESPSGGGAINVTYNVNATVDLSDETVKLLYANPQASNQNVALLIMIDDLVVAKSDLITPGNGVETLKLDAFAKKKIQVGGYNAELVIRSYDPNSGEKAMVDTKGQLSLTVVE